MSGAGGDLSCCLLHPLLDTSLDFDKPAVWFARCWMPPLTSTSLLPSEDAYTLWAEVLPPTLRWVML